MNQITPYKPKHKVRIVTAASLFDGHDAAINIMRRIIQSTGVEVIHLGHDRSVEDVVNCAIQEDVNAIAMTSYQGGHNEYFKYMYDLLKEKGASHIKIFGGGGGVILPKEIKELMKYGITRIYSPDDGRELGLQGMINDLLRQCDYATGTNIKEDVAKIESKDYKSIARIISAGENFNEENLGLLNELKAKAEKSSTPVLGITGTGGSGKSSLAFDTLYAYRHRCYVESLSSYTHKFLGRLDTPKVEHIKGISPAIAIKQKVNTTNTRSTVGTEIKIYDCINLLFAEWVELYRQFLDKTSKKRHVF